jgi:hypothetical protein
MTLSRGIGAGVALFGLLFGAGAAFGFEAAAKSAVNVRTGPGLSYGIVDKLDAGEVVSVTECSPTNFCFVQHDGPDGWVSAGYLVPTDDAAAADESAGAGKNPKCSFGFTMGSGVPSLSVNCGDNPPPPPPPPAPGDEPSDDEPGACFYSGNNYSGDQLCVGLGQRKSLPAFNDRISSIELYGGAVARICVDNNFGGLCQNITSDKPSLGAAINNRTSSFKVTMGLPVPPPPVVPVTYSTALLDVPQTYEADLDTGVVGSAGADFWFEAQTAILRYITPVNGARIAVGDGSNRGFAGCSVAAFSPNRVSIGAVPPGTYVCMRTNEGRIAQFRVNGFVGTTLKIGYTTWAN